MPSISKKKKTAKKKKASKGSSSKPSPGNYAPDSNHDLESDCDVKSHDEREIDASIKSEDEIDSDGGEPASPPFQDSHGDPSDNQVLEEDDVNRHNLCIPPLIPDKKSSVDVTPEKMEQTFQSPSNPPIFPVNEFFEVSHEKEEKFYTPSDGPIVSENAFFGVSHEEKDNFFDLSHEEKEDVFYTPSVGSSVSLNKFSEVFQNEMDNETNEGVHELNSVKSSKWLDDVKELHEQSFFSNSKTENENGKEMAHNSATSETLSHMDSVESNVPLPEKVSVSDENLNEVPDGHSFADDSNKIIIDLENEDKEITHNSVPEPVSHSDSDKPDPSVLGETEQSFFSNNKTENENGKEMAHNSATFETLSHMDSVESNVPLPEKISVSDENLNEVPDGHSFADDSNKIIIDLENEDKEITHNSVPEPVSHSDSDKPDPPVLGETVSNQFSDTFQPIEDFDVVMETDPVIDSSKHEFLLVGSDINQTETVPVNSFVDSNIVVLGVKENDLLPPLDEVAVVIPPQVDSSSKGIDEKNTMDEIVVACSYEIKDTSLLPANVSNVHQSANDMKSEATYNSSENEPLLSAPPSRAKTSYWKSCCGLLDLLTGSDR